MQNHTDTKKPAGGAEASPKRSRKEQKLALALKRNLARRKASIRAPQTGSEA